MTEGQRAEMNAIKWLHRIELEPGFYTPGNEFDIRDQYIILPPSFEGLRVLDLGAWDGKYSFLAEKRGAAYVLAIDTWDGTGSRGPGEAIPTKAGFNFAKKILKSWVSSIDVEACDFLDTHAGMDPFDVVLCFGLLYHVPDPVRLLAGAAKVLKPGGLLCIETEVSAMNVDYPAAEFWPTGTESDPTNWWGLNYMCLKAILGRLGVSVKETGWSPYGNPKRTRCAVLTEKNKL